MAEVKNKLITVESLSALHDYNEGAYTFSNIITIPSGRMLGDVNGDGKIDTNDVKIVQEYASGTNIEFDEEYADVNKDGVIDAFDAVYITKIVSGDNNSEVVLGKENWALNSNYGNPNYATKEMRVYTDIAIENMAMGDFIIVTVMSEDYDKDFFYVESFNKSLRLYAKTPTIYEVVAIVQYGRNAGNIANVSEVNSLCNGATRLKNLLADGATVLSSYQYGDALPAAGTVGRIFFKRLVE